VSVIIACSVRVFLAMLIAEMFLRQARGGRTYEWRDRRDGGIARVRVVYGNV